MPDAAARSTSSAARRAEAQRYLLELIANDDEAKLFELARLHGWPGPRLDYTADANKLAAIRHIADVLTLPWS